MSITGRSFGRACRTFADHLNHILNTTVTQRRLSIVISNQQIAVIGFRTPARASEALIHTSYGRMELDLRQTCDATIDEESNQLTLRTLSYRYTLRPAGAAEPLLRWEFVRFPADADATWNRHHFQGPIRLGIYDSSGVEAILNRWHLPSGSIAIEDVLRFCITDLGVRPLVDDWDRRLQDT